MNPEIRKYLSKIGRKGGEASRRVLTQAQAKNMVRIREANRAFHKFYSRCFWHLNPDIKITRENLPLIIKGLRLYGGHQGFLTADKLGRD